MSSQEPVVRLPKAPLIALRDNAEAALQDDAYPFPGAHLGVAPQFVLKLLAVVAAVDDLRSWWLPDQPLSVGDLRGLFDARDAL